MKTFVLTVCALVALAVFAIGASARKTPVPLVSAETEQQKVREAEKQRVQTAHLTRLARKVATSRASTWDCQDTLDMKRTRAEVWVWDLPESVPYRGWVLKKWKSYSRSCDKVLRHRTLPNTNDFETAVKIAQRVFPGTEEWGMSCSGAEGGHSVWVLYHHVPYYPGAEYARTFWGWMVGGPFQYMWPTFKGHYRRALDEIHRRGFIIKLPAVEDVAAWRSMQAQALAGTWARWAGEDNSHWAASWDNGCR